TRRISANLQLYLAPGKAGRFAVDDGSLEDASFRLRALGGLASLRFDLVRFSTFALYVDAGLGGLNAHHGYLPGEMEQSWVETAGGGILCRLDANTYFSTGVRY